MIFEQGVYGLDVDVERTRAYYAQAGGVDCGCSGCRNYAVAVKQMPRTVRGFLEQFGIDPAKPAETTAYNALADGQTWYHAWFHICGQIQEGTEPFRQTGPKSFELKREYQIPLGGDSDVWFMADCDLLDKAFPRPAYQLEVTFYLPWVLEEPNDYLYEE